MPSRIAERVLGIASGRAPQLFVLGVRVGVAAEAVLGIDPAAHALVVAAAWLFRREIDADARTCSRRPRRADRAPSSFAVEIRAGRAEVEAAAAIRARGSVSDVGRWSCNTADRHGHERAEHVAALQAAVLIGMACIAGCRIATAGVDRGRPGVFQRHVRQPRNSRPCSASRRPCAGRR